MSSKHPPTNGAVRRALLRGVGVAALFAVSCAPAAPRWNVLLVTFDTTRADHLGCYGHERARTPVADGLAAEGVLFEEAMAPVPITLPSHSSLMTGKVPLAHGVRDNGLFVLGEEQETLAEILRQAGYRTAAAIGSFPLLSRFGIGQGFDLFDDHLTSPYEDLHGQRVLPKDRFFFDERRAARVNEALLPWLEENADEPFFAWLHYFDPHHPHEPPPPYDQLFVHDLYDGEIAYSDESLGAVLARLEELGVADRTLVILTSDHGEGRGEHDESTHSHLTYQSTLRVPLVMRIPGGPAGLRIEERVSTVDVLPTVLDLLGLEPPAGIQGISLRTAIEGGRGATRPRPIYAETLSPRLSRGWGELRALVVDDSKYIHGPRPELYDLGNDPHELDDLLAEKPELAEKMRLRLEDYLAEHAADGLDSSVALDEETVRRLEALGYLQSSGEKVGAIEERLREDGDPPQDHAATITAFSQARNLLFEGRALDAQRFIRDLLRTDPENPYYLELLLLSEVRTGDGDGALEVLARLEEMEASYPSPDRLLNLEAQIRLARGEAEEAHDLYREAEALSPTVEGQYRLALYHQARGNGRETLRYLDGALDLDSAFAPALVDRALQLIFAGELELAEEELELALAADPFLARAHYNYGALLVQTDRWEQAVSRFERATQLRPGYHRARAAKVEALIELDRLEEAEAEGARIEQLAPGSPAAALARQLLGEAG